MYLFCFIARLSCYCVVPPFPYFYASFSYFNVIHTYMLDIIYVYIYINIYLHLNYPYMILHLYFLDLAYFAYMIITKSFYFSQKKYYVIFLYIWVRFHYVYALRTIISLSIIWWLAYVLVPYISYWDWYSDKRVVSIYSGIQLGFFFHLEARILSSFLNPQYILSEHTDYLLTKIKVARTPKKALKQDYLNHLPQTMSSPLTAFPSSNMSTSSNYADLCLSLTFCI